jgi:hypothetical protein
MLRAMLVCSFVQKVITQCVKWNNVTTHAFVLRLCSIMLAHLLPT